MPKYYCDYCKSYLTHDKMSVRKSHLAGRHHIELYCAYYEEKARQLGILNSEDFQYEVDLAYLTSKAPSPTAYSKKKIREQERATVKRADDTPEEVCIPPPPNLGNMPAPPPSVLRRSDEDLHSVAVMTARQNVLS